MQGGLSRTLRALLLLPGAFLVFLSPALTQSGDAPPAFTTRTDYPAWATVEIDIGESPGDVVVHVTFDSSAADETVFVLTSINTKRAPYFPDLLDAYRARIAPYEALLTNDFDLRPVPDEYWIGTRLDGSTARKTVRIAASGFLARIDGVLERYELAINDRQIYFEASQPGAAKIVYVPVIRYIVRGPSWSELEFEDSDKWLALGDERYAFQPTEQITSLRAVISQGVPGPGEWLQSKLAVAIAGFACSLIFFGVFYDATEPDRRAARFIPFVLLLILAGIVFIVARPESSFAHALFYDGAFFLGAMIPALVFAVLPTSALRLVRQFIRQIRTPMTGR